MGSKVKVTETFSGGGILIDGFPLTVIWLLLSETLYVTHAKSRSVAGHNSVGRWPVLVVYSRSFVLDALLYICSTAAASYFGRPQVCVSECAYCLFISRRESS